MKPPSTELAPTRLGVIAQRYELEVLLGVGGMGAVYRARDRELDEVVALKLLGGLEGKPVSEIQLERFRREVRLARRVTHPNAARVYDLGHDAEIERWYLTMELISGESLAERLVRERRLEPWVACRIAADICAGLGAIHAAGIVHRDLKPGNILLAAPDEEGHERVVVTDFGIAKSVDFAEASFTRGVIGTPGYMAPEQALGTYAVDPRSDIFALGTILYQMVSGHHPGDIATPQDLGEAVLWPPPLAPITGLDDTLAQLVSRCLARPPHERPDSCALIEPILRSLADERDADPGDLNAAFPRAKRPPTLRPTKAPHKPVLSILPLRQRGAASDDIGATISEELIDLLSRCSGLWVSSFSATEGYATQRDPQRLARELGSDYVVDGSAQMRGSALRVTIRLIDASKGVQLWSETATGELEDVFELQDRLAQTIAESLRVELTLRTREQELDAEAMSLYICAREGLREGFESLGSAYRALDRALELEPGFEAAAALRASAALRAWFLHSHEDDHMWERRAHEAVTVARAVAPELSTTHQACAIFSLHSGDFVQAVNSFQRALVLAPTNPMPTHYLGMIDIETGQFERGMARLELAHGLMPRSLLPIAELARCTALLGHTQAHVGWMAKLAALPGGRLTHALTQLRVAAWRRDAERLASSWQAAVQAGEEAGQPLTVFRAYAPEMAHEYASAMAEGRSWAAGVRNGRFRALIYQFLVEMACYHEQHDEALELLELALAGHFIDIGWLERCPLLDGLREHPRYASLRSRLRERVVSLGQ